MHSLWVLLSGATCLEGEEGVDVDGADAQALCGSVVGIDEGVRADGVLRVAAVAGAVGGQAEADPHRRLESAVAGGPGDQLRDAAKQFLHTGKLLFSI